MLDGNLKPVKKQKTINFNNMSDLSVILASITIIAFLFAIIFDVPETIYDYFLNWFLVKKTVIRTDHVGWHYKEIVRSDGTIIFRKSLTINEYKQEIRKQKFKRITNEKF